MVSSSRGKAAHDYSHISSDDPRLIEAIDLAKRIAKKKSGSLISFEDAFSAAQIGALKAVESFDDTGNVAFAAIAKVKINCEIIDEVRRIRGRNPMYPKVLPICEELKGDR